MTEIQLFDIGGSFRDGVERGRKRSTLRDFFAPAAGGDRNALARLMQVDPQAAQSAQSMATAGRKDSQERIGQLAGVYAQTQDPAVWRGLRQSLAEHGFPNEMPWEIASDEDRAGSVKFATAIAQQYGGGAGDANTVQSRFVGEDGQIYALMRDSTVKPLGIKADPNTEIINAAGGYFGVDKRSLGATPVRIGQPGAQQRAPGEVPFAIDPNLPPEVQASIRANESQWAQKPEMNIGGDLSHIPPLSTYTGGGRQLQAAPKPGPQQTDIERRLEMARQMGATPEELKRMVVGGESGRDAQRISTADATKARQKLTQIQSARQQLNAVKQAFQKLRGSFSAGLGGNYLPTPEGQAFDRAIRNLSPLITAVTRVPGVGSMSDYEGRLAEQALPSRGTYENVTEQQIADLERLLNTIEGGYTDLLGTGKPAAPAANQGWSIQKVGD